MEVETIPDCRLYVIRAPREGVVVYSGLAIQGLNIKAVRYLDILILT